MDDAELWRWIWLGTAVAFGLGEMTSPGSFFLAPFAIGAAVASVAAFLGVDAAPSWIAFLVVSVIAFAALRPLARRLDRNGEGNPIGVGAGRLLGHRGVVIDEIPPGPDTAGLVRVGREEWRAQTSDGVGALVGLEVTVTEVRGTSLVVAPFGATTAPMAPPTAPPTAEPPSAAADPTSEQT